MIAPAATVLAVIGPAVTLVTYLGHYLVARLLYDDLVRPLAHGNLSIALLVAGGTGVGYALGRRSGRRG